MPPLVTNMSQYSDNSDLSPPPAAMNDGDLSPEHIHLPPSPPPELDQDVARHLSNPPTSVAPTITKARPETPRRSTSAESTSTMASITTHSMVESPRNRSPSRMNPRTQFGGYAISLPLMQRAHSSPGVDSTGRFITPGYIGPHRPSSPLGHVGRRRSPLRSAMEESYPGSSSWSGMNIEPNIPEHEELDISSTQFPLTSVSESEESQSSPLSLLHSTFPRSRRRPNSPLHQSASAPTLFTRAVSPSVTPGGHSPSLAPQKYMNQPYPGYSFSSASSMPSTPTSLRSRSPSISSLETIEDSPDAEEAAMIEAEEMAKLRAEEAEGSGGESRRRSSLELRSGSLRSNKDRKRWSVSGAERRADFSLEPIEE